MYAVIITAIVLLALLFYSAMRDFVVMIYNIPFFTRLRYTEADCERIRNYLQEFPYYNSLNSENKPVFQERVIRFIINKEITGKEGLIVTEKTKVLIAATATQLTFGIEDYCYPHFNQIFVFKGEFGYPGSKVNMVGATKESGKIYLSLKHFISGFVIPDDGYNLGLHEFAHALKLEMEKGEAFDATFERHFPDWKNHGMETMSAMKDGKSGFLRTYALTNIDEYFAVSVERFFETPLEFREKLPAEYRFLCTLLRQDPAMQSAAPSRPFSHEVPVIFKDENIKLRLNDDTWHWSDTTTLAGFIFGFPLLVLFASFTVITMNQLIALAACCAVLNLFTWPYFKQHGFSGKIRFSLFCIFGAGFLIPVGILALNLLIPIQFGITEIHKVEKCRIEKSFGDRYTTYTLSDPSYEKCIYLTTFYDKPCYEPDVQLTFNKGIFGLRTISELNSAP